MKRISALILALLLALTLLGCAPAAEASENVTLSARSGRTEGIIAVETQGTQGYVCVEGAFRERISGRTAEGRVPLAPYEVLVLEKIR